MTDRMQWLTRVLTFVGFLIAVIGCARIGESAQGPQITGLLFSSELTNATQREVGESIIFRILVTFSDGTSKDVSAEMNDDCPRGNGFRGRCIYTSNDELALLDRETGGWRLTASDDLIGTIGIVEIYAHYEGAFIRHGLEIIPPARGPVRPVDPRFNDAFWREFVYEGHPADDRGEPIISSRVLPSPATVSFYLRTEPWPAKLPRDVWIPRIRDQLGSMVSQLTGTPWRGRFETGPERANRTNWITIRFRESDGCHAYAEVGRLRGHIGIGYTQACFSLDSFPYTLAHELGHAFGFLHVSDINAVMWTGYENGEYSRRSTFTPIEQYHARLAYEAGRNQPYCGWPFGESCQTPTNGGRSPAPTGTLPDRRLAPDDTLNVDVSGAFVDPDGDALTYTVSSSAPQTVTARAEGALVTLTAVGEGAATIRVTATDPGGLSAMQSFTVRVSMPVSRSFTDDPLQPGVTPVKAVHFTELRTRIDALRRAGGLQVFAWTDPVLRTGVTRVRLTHLLELREALAAAYAAAGRSAPGWTDGAPSAGTTPIRAAHLMELRAAILALE